MGQLTAATKKGLRELHTADRISDESLLYLDQKVKDYGHRKPYAEGTDCPHLSAKAHKEDKSGGVE